jgi:hypothetical protein
MDKDSIKILIAEYQQEVVNIDLMERPLLVEETLNYVFVGLRRAGKSRKGREKLRMPSCSSWFPQN